MSLQGNRGALVTAVVLVAAACRAPSAPPRDAVQEAFKDSTLTAHQARGHRVFLTRCATCHGPQGRGDGQNAYNLDPRPPDFQQSLSAHRPSYWRQIVEGGSAAVGRSPLCPPWGRALSARDIDALIAYLAALQRPASAAPGPAPGGAVSR